MRTSISKKLLAGALSVMMVLSLVAPTGAQAATNVKLSATKATLASGKSKIVTIKNVKASNVKKLTVKSNKKTVATVKKVSNVKFKVTGSKKLTAKKTATITAKLTLKNAVNGKKNYTFKFKATVKAKATKKVAVTGVSLNNTTPKVGDTLTATVEPADATNVTYAWFMGDSATQVETAIEGQTGASLTVTEAMVGKFIKVVVNGDNSSAANATTTAAVEAAATEKIAIASAKQIGAAKLSVTFNKKVNTADWDITVSRGTTAQSITTVLDEAATTATITLGTALAAGEYTVKIVKKADATENATATVTAEQAVLKGIDFTGDQLILADSTMKVASVSIKGVNQFDEDVALSGALTVYSTKGNAEYVQKDKKIKLTCTGTIFFTTGEQVTVTAVYNNGNVPLQVSKALTVSNVATLTEFELGDIATTRTSLKDKRVDLANLGTETYYFPVKVAKDQYGNDLTASELDAMMVKGTADASKNLYITPAQADGSYAYVTGFTLGEDGKTIQMNINRGSLNTPGKAIFSITGVSGYQGTKELEIQDNPYIATLSVSAPTLYMNREAELTISAKDQYGDDVDLYEKTADTPAAGEDITFSDLNGLTKGHSSIKFSDTAASVTLKKDTSKKTIKYIYKPMTKGQTVVTVQSATPAVNNLTWTVDATPTIAGIAGLKSTIDTNLDIADTTSTIVDFTTKTNMTWLDSSGATVKAADLPATLSYVATAPVLTANPLDGFYYTVSAPSNTDILNLAGGVLKVKGTKAGTASVTVTLYEVATSNGTKKINTLAEKTFKFTVANTADPKATYEAALATGDSLLYVNAASKDSTGFDVEKVDSDGNAVAFEDYSVTVDSDLKVSGQKVIGKVSGISAKGTAVATIWVNGKAVATVDVPYDVAAPAPQKLNTTIDAFPNTTAMDVNENGSVTITDATVNTTAPHKTTIYIADQYGLPMENTTWKIGGKTIGASSLDNSSNAAAKQYALTATSGKVSGSWTLTVAANTTATITLASDEVKLASISGPAGGSELAWNDTTGITLTAKYSDGSDVLMTDLTLLRVVKAGSETNVAASFAYTGATGAFAATGATNAPAVGSYTATFVSTSKGNAVDWYFTVVAAPAGAGITFTEGSQLITAIENPKADASAHAGKLKVNVTTDENLSNQPGTYKLYKVTAQPSASATTELIAANLLGTLTVAQNATDPEDSGVLEFTLAAGVTTAGANAAKFCIVFVPNADYYNVAQQTTLYSTISGSVAPVDET